MRNHRRSGLSSLSSLNSHISAQAFIFSPGETLFEVPWLSFADAFWRSMREQRLSGLALCRPARLRENRGVPSI
jgi:hypothetical protein